MCVSPYPLASPVGAVLLFLPFQSGLPALLVDREPWAQLLLLTWSAWAGQLGFLHLPSGRMALL